MTTSTIPYTPTAPGWTPTPPRPLRDFRLHPDLNSTETPALPTPARPSLFHTTPHGIYHITTHLIPAAYPRLTPKVPLPELPTFVPSESRTARRDKAVLLMKQAIETQDAYVEGRLPGESSDTLLWNCINRYVRTSPGHTGVTLFLANANGLHKETWEPMLRELLKGSAGQMVDEVWAWDPVQHGDAAVINAQNLNGIYDWLDNTRDVANFLLYYLPEEVKTTVLPTRLARLPVSAMTIREREGYRMRKLVVVGHSFGGTTSLRVAYDFPKLFSSFVLIDPVIFRPAKFRPGGAEQIVLGAFTRRDRWSSREEALDQFKRVPFFAAWHPSVLQCYVDYALIDDSKGGVRLKMSGLQEGLSFTNRALPWETWELLDKLDKGIALRWVIPNDSGVFGDAREAIDVAHEPSSKQMMYEKVWRRPANASNVVFHFAGHLVVQEAPLELAREISEFLLRKYGSPKPHL